MHTDEIFSDKDKQQDKQEKTPEIQTSVITSIIKRIDDLDREKKNA